MKLWTNRGPLKVGFPELFEEPALPEDLCDLVIVKPSTRARRMALRLDTKAQMFKLIVPEGLSVNRAFAFARKHKEWMEEKLAELPSLIPIQHGAVIPLFGKDHVIDISHDRDLGRTSVWLEDGVLRVDSNLDDPRSRIVRFLKKEAQARLEILSRQKAAVIATRVSVRDTKSRWGSCSHDANISYSWRLIFAPYVSMDYVVAHEVAHLEHLDHSKAFWCVCRDLSENYVEGKYWIRNHGSDLMRYVWQS